MPRMLDNAPRSRALRQLRLWIARGDLPAGERLPTEQVLARRLAVSRGTVRAAVAVLERDGAVHQDGGRKLVARPDASPARGLLARTVALLSVSREHADVARGGGYTAAVDAGVIDALQEGGLAALALPEALLHPATLDDLCARPPLGAFLSNRFMRRQDAAAWIQRLRAAAVPLVTECDEPAVADLDRVVSDHAAGSELLVRWLAARGRRRIGFITVVDPADHWWLRQRLAGWSAAIAGLGLAAVPPTLAGPLPVDGDLSSRARHLAGHLVQRLTGATRLDALLVASDGEVPMVAAALRLFGLEPNRDVDLVGYDAYWHSAPRQPGEPAAPLATVDKRNAAGGARLAALLLDRIAGRLPPDPQRVVISPELVVVAGGSGSWSR